MNFFGIKEFFAEILFKNGCKNKFNDKNKKKYAADPKIRFSK